MKERAISRLLGIWYRYKNTDNWSGTALEIGSCIIDASSQPVKMKMDNSSFNTYWFAFFLLFQTLFALNYLSSCSKKRKQELRAQYEPEQLQGVMGSEWLGSPEEVQMSVIIPLVISWFVGGVIRMFL